MPDDKMGSYIKMPEIYSRRELNRLYREIPLKDTTFRTLRKYFNAMANLYGIIPLRKAYDIISSQNPRLVCLDEFLAFSEIARHECGDYHFPGADGVYIDGKLKDALDREIIDTSLLDDDPDAYHIVQQMQRGKPYYVPPKANLLAYDDPFYVEPSSETNELKAFLLNRLKLSEQEADDVFVEILFGTRCMGADLTQVISRLQDMGISFQRDRDIQAFAKLYQQFHNQTRMQCNRGYTPMELRAIQPPENRIPKAISLGPNIRKGLSDGTIDAEQFRQSVLTANFPNEDLRFSLLREINDAAPKGTPKTVKIGRNDPCPCGSGKKYKKCCGR